MAYPNEQQNFRVAVMSNDSTTPVLVHNVSAYTFLGAIEVLQDELLEFQVTRGRYLKKLTIDVVPFDNQMLMEFNKPRKPRKK